MQIKLNLTFDLIVLLKKNSKVPKVMPYKLFNSKLLLFFHSSLQILISKEAGDLDINWSGIFPLHFVFT